MPVEHGHFRAGFAVADMTPDPSARRVELSGFVARHQPALGIRDRLQSSVLALQIDDRPPLCLVGLDVCALDHAALERIAGACPVPAHHVVCMATHAHSGPAVYRLLGCGQPDPDYVRQLALWVGDAAQRALNALVPCRVSWGRRAIDPRHTVARPLGGVDAVRIAAHVGGAFRQLVHVLEPDRLRPARPERRMGRRDTQGLLVRLGPHSPHRAPYGCPATVGLLV